MHIPVLKKEVLQYLDPRPNENFIDCTINGGGHTYSILEKNKPNGKVLGIEIDPEIFKKLKSSERLIIIKDSYTNLEKIVKENNFKSINGILFDLGMSSWHLEESGRGFTFLKDEPLDMRYSLENDLTAEEIVNNYSQKEIEKIFKEYGEERFAKRLARRILEQRPIKSTFQLAEIIRKSRIYSPNRIFQSLRIAVNNELENLKKGLTQAVEVLKPEGRIAVISFHSLEDRIVKNFFKDSNLNILSKKPTIPSEKEIKINPRSRSAKLRAALKK